MRLLWVTAMGNIAGITGRLWKGKHHLSGDSSMSAEEMGTNDCRAEGRREAKFVSINVREYDCESTTGISVHWGATCGNSFVEEWIFLVKRKLEILPALQQGNFKCWGNQLVEKQNNLLVLEKYMWLFWIDRAIVLAVSTGVNGRCLTVTVSSLPCCQPANSWQHSRGFLTAVLI